MPLRPALPLLPALLLILTASAARADSVGASLSLGRTEQPGTSAGAGISRQSYSGAGLTGRFEPIEDKLSLGFAYFASSVLHGSPLQSISGSAEYALDDHWMAGARLGGSPVHSTPVTPVTPASGTNTVSEVSRNSNFGGDLTIAWDGNGDTELEWGGDGLVGLRHFSSKLSSHSSGAKMAGAKAPADAVNQLGLGLGGTGTFWQATSFTLSGTWYLYDQSAAALAEFGLHGRAGTVIPAGGDQPLAPLRWDAQALLYQRFSALFSASLRFGGGQYVSGGSALSGTAKVSLKPARWLKLSLAATSQRDVDRPGAAPLNTNFGTLGAEYRW